MKRIRAKTAVAFLGLGLCMMLLTGCGGERTYKVEGKVQFADGSPVMFGTIEFLNRERKLNARGKIKRDGTFTVTTFKPNDGAIKGDHVVTIQQFATVPLVNNQIVRVEHDHGNLVHEKYRSYSKSDLPPVTIEAKSPNEVLIIVEPMKDQVK